MSLDQPASPSRNLPLYTTFLCMIVFSCIGLSGTALASGPPPEAESPCESGKSPRWYASESGSDANLGTEAHPFRSVKRLLAKLYEEQHATEKTEVGCLEPGPHPYPSGIEESGKHQLLEIYGPTSTTACKGGSTIAESESKCSTVEGAEVAAVGESAKHPLILASARAEEPATIIGGILMKEGPNYIWFEHLILDEEEHTPYGCWKGGSPVQHEVLPSTWSTGTTESTCEVGYPAADPEGPEKKQYGSGIAVSGYDHDTKEIVPTTGDEFLYDDIDGHHTPVICLNLGTGESYFVAEHDRIHGCGPWYSSGDSAGIYNKAHGGFEAVNSEPGWHMHAWYDYGSDDLLKNSYVYENSRNGCLLYGSVSAERNSCEHNIIDSNGNGVTIEQEQYATIKWNVITASDSYRSEFDDAISFQGGGAEHAVVEHNDVLPENPAVGHVFLAPYNLDGGTLGCPEGAGEVDCKSAHNLEGEASVLPEYASPAAHEYEFGSVAAETLHPKDPSKWYGPETPPTRY